MKSAVISGVGTKFFPQREQFAKALKYCAETLHCHRSDPVRGQNLRWVLGWSVTYQPNDFVNPYQRGVELPAGYKDLNELLQKIRAQKRERPTFQPRRGSLKDVPRYVQKLYMEHYGLSLAVTIRAAEAILCVHNRRGGCRLTLLLREQHTMLAPVVQELFGKVGFHEEAREKMKVVTAPVPHLWLEAAQIVRSVIIGFGATENADLLFHFVWRRKEGDT